MIQAFEKDLDEQQIESLIQKIIQYKDTDGQQMLQVFNIEYINNYLSRNLTQIEQIFHSYQNKKGIDIIDFLFQMLTHMEYNSNQALYLAVALIDFYQGIVENENLQQIIKFQNITNYICENDPGFSEGNVDDRKIPSKKLPDERKFQLSKQQRVVRDIDINPPIIYKDDDNQLRRLTKEKNCIDAVHHNKNMIIVSHHAETIQKVITLDSYSDHFLFYDQNCNVTRELYPKIQQQNQGIFKLKNQVCICFYWSQKQQRIGASFRDGYLVFWEASDNFEYEKVFQIGQFLSEEQTKIWYVECIDKWVTTDKKNQLYVWDLEKEIISSTLKSETFSKGILQILEIPYLRLVAVATCDNQIAIWDFLNLKQLFKIEVDHTHLNQIVFFKTYQIILTAGYDNTVNIYSLHSTYNDYNSLGKLSGHQTLVTSIQCIENTPMVITADDRFNIKVWDIRKMKCIQNMNIDLRNSIRFIHILKDRICLISSRVTCLFFEDELNSQKVKESLHPIAIEYDPNRKEMGICSRKDVKYIDISTGRIKKIISGIISSQEDEITTFRVFQQNKKFLIGNQKGIIKIFSSRDGENIGKIQGHNDEVSVIKMDYLNRLLTSASFDGNIFIQKEQQNGTFEKIREIYIGKEIQNLEISVYHNLMVVTFSNNELYLINYEFGRLMSIFYLSPHEEPTCLEFISGYSIFIVGTTLGNIHFVQFKMHDDTIDLKLVAKIRLNGEKEEEIEQVKMQQINEDLVDLLTGTNTEKKKDEQKFGNSKFNVSPRKQDQQQLSSKNQMISLLNTNSLQQNQISQLNSLKMSQQLTGRTDSSQQNTQKSQLQNPAMTQKKEITTIPSKIMLDIGKMHLIVSLHNGQIQIYDINSLFQIKNVKKIPHCNTKSNYNAFRSSKEDFTKVIDKIRQFKIQNNQIVKDVQQSSDNVNYLANTIFLGSVQIDNFTNSVQQANNNILSPRNNSSKVRQSQIRSIFQAKNVVKEENQIQTQIDPQFNQTQNLIKSINAHKDSIHCLQFIDLGKKYVLTSSLDCYIKIWQYPEMIVCANLNTEHPLPIKWDIEIDQTRQYKTKILYALQSMKCMIQKYGAQINHLQEKEQFISKTESSPQNSLKKVRDSFQSLLSDQVKANNQMLQIQQNDYQSRLEKQTNQFDQVLNKPDTRTKIRLMKDDYTVRDLIFDKIKDFYQEELKGPSLKHLNEMKKLYEAQQQQKKQNNITQFDLDSQYKYKFERQEEKSKEFKHITTFLDDKYRVKVLEKPNAEFFDKIKYVEDLDERLDRSLQKKKRTAIIVLNDGNSSKDLNTSKQMKKDTQKKMLSIQKKIRQSPRREIKENSNQGDTFIQTKNSKNDFRITNSTSCNSFQNKNDSFYQYACKKNLLDDQSSLNYSELNKNYKNIKTNNSEQNIYRKTETKYFSNIMKKMDEKLRKSKGQFQQPITYNYQNFITFSDQNSNEATKQSFGNNFFYTHKRNFSNNIKLDSLAVKNLASSNTDSQVVDNNPTFQTSNYSTTFGKLYKRAESKVLKKY